LVPDSLVLAEPGRTAIMTSWLGENRQIYGQSLSEAGASLPLR
jgi:hypothetical protein